MDEQDKFVPRDATTIKPKDVRVGDYFNYDEERYLVAGIDCNIFGYLFTGLIQSRIKEDAPEYMGLFTSPSGRNKKFEILL